MRNQVLIVGPTKSGKLTIAKEIFNAKLEDYIEKETINHSGITIDELNLSSKYYNTKVGLFIDELEGDSMDKFNDWFNEFKSEDVKELRDYIQGIIFTIDFSVDIEDITKICKHLEEISNQLDDEFIELNQKDDVYQWDGFKVVVGMNKKSIEVETNTNSDKLLEIEDLILSSGFEFVNYDDERIPNEYGDVFGKERLIEILQNNEWRDVEINKNRLENPKKIEATRKELSMPLLEQKDENRFKEIDELSVIMQKLKQAKLDVTKMENNSNKEEYVNKVVENLVKYI